MKDSVKQAFVAFTERFEGSVATMYLDIKGLVTVAIGNLIDPVGAALDMPFLRKDGTPASRAEIGAEWRKMKGNPGLAQAGWRAAAAVASLHLGPEGIAAVVQSKLAANEAYLKTMKGRFPEWDTFPADAQLGILSMAWACGPAFHFPMFEAAVHRKDWIGAMNQSHMEDSHNAGLRPRNAADLVLFSNAAKVQAGCLDFEVLHYPTVL